MTRREEVYRRTQTRRGSAIVMVVAVPVLAALACTPTVTTGPEPTTQASTETAVTEVAKPTEALATPAETGGGEIVTTAEPVQPTGQLTADNAANLHEVRSIRAAGNLIEAGALSPTIHQGATFASDRYVRVWDVDTGDLVYRLGPQASDGFGLAYSPDGTKLASGGGFEVIIWDPNTGRQIKSVTVNAYVYRLTWSPDSRYIAVVGEQSSKIDIIDTQVGAVVSRISTLARYVLEAVAYSPDGSLLAVADFDGNLTILTPTGDLIAEDNATGKGAVWEVGFSPDGSMLATCNGSGDVYFWNTASWTAIPAMTLRDIHPGGCTDGIFSRGGDVYLSVGADGILNLWDTATGSLINVLAFNSYIWTVSISGDGQLVAVALDNGTFHILSVQ